ncbi:MAG: exodeoxyribonuclease VII large subunit [Tannerella sp.]|jgi:exodeoxyribonuclease VII large subunit|nr:exodeoxyribonuclease VII large subunit [Tannerella sp.]
MPYGNIEIDIENNSHEAMSLLELNINIQDAIQDALPETYWVRAEVSDVRVNASSGHCYLEFVEKEVRSGQIVAKARGTIWSRTFQILKPYFEQETGQPFTSGLKVLMNVSVEFHELYGYSLSVHDIDPSYTLGDMVKKRKEIVRRLQEEGIFELNKELPFPLLPQRIAVITSPTAAGYEDFMHQLAENEYSFPFYVKIFPAIMQGEKTEESVIAALDRIFTHTDCFDVVVIIRGGGSTSELSSFDSYPLAANCAQFPLPVITGIGHERDDTVVDMVAHTRMKTPTAVASFLIECMAREAAQLQESEQFITDYVTGRITREKIVLQTLTAKLPVTATGRIERHRSQLHTMTSHLSSLPQWIHHHMEKLDELPSRLQRASDAMISARAAMISDIPSRLRRASEALFTERRQTMDLNEQYIRMVSPEYILQRGYTLTFKEGRIVKSAEGLSVGDEITVKFSDGEKKGKII